MKRFSGKREDWSVQTIGKNDLVLLECNIYRWKVNNEGKAIYTDDWRLCRTAFEILTVNLLNIGPEIETKVRVPEIEEFI
ncbi:hypothetical protein SCP_0410380 [Sparassis crispa]|uniref:Uncharacterized protein n=1 Tax=Sparassis crispa TaxID=139825 RepID=A0A401GKF4_9APHY|nr:hypothetical protein SCP_0410380 [Sparassis crispa]GBE82653.1 hypothetical protein SCP_0410380 [Sparassis crispa]